MKHKIYHIHIRKTAGTALKRYILNSFSNELVCPIRSEFELRAKIPIGQRLTYIKNYSFISGHFYSFGQSLKGEYFVFSMLRNPLDRALSAFNHMKNDTNDIYHKKILKLSLKQAFEDERFNKELNNGQTRQIVYNAGYDYDSLTAKNAVEVAKEFLQEINFVGIQEMINTSCTLLGKALDIEFPNKMPVWNKKITAAGIKKDQLKEDDVLLIQRNNLLDMELYQFAIELLDKRYLPALIENSSLNHSGFE